MKKTILSFHFIFIVFGLSAQIVLDACADNMNYLFTENLDEFLIIDTMNNPDNIWAFGKVDKDSINLPIGTDDLTVLVTDTMLPYPTNDTSSFIFPICHYYGNFYPTTTLITVRTDFYMDSDSLNDFGKIELSIDEGQTWWDMSEGEDPNVANFEYPVLTGNSETVQNVSFNLESHFHFNSEYNDHLWSLIDSVGIQYLLLKYTFVSDSIPDNKLGWMITNIQVFQALFSSVDETNTLQTKIIPNPADQYLTIEIEEENSTYFELSIISINGRNIHQQSLNNNSSVNINTSTFPPGIYQCLIENEDRTKRSMQKIIIQH